MARDGPGLSGGGTGGPDQPGGGGGRELAQKGASAARAGRKAYRAGKKAYETIQTGGVNLTYDVELWLWIVKAALYTLVPLALLAVVLMIGMTAAGAAQKEAEEEQQQQVGSCIPGGVVATRNLVRLYELASARYGLDPKGPSILAAINAVETSFGSNVAVSSAGAQGWMQFMPATWEAYGVDADGDGERDPYNPADAIFAAANYLAASGAPGDWRDAIFAYNHLDSYVEDVLKRAERYEAEGRVVSDTGRVIGSFGEQPSGSSGVVRVAGTAACAPVPTGAIQGGARGIVERAVAIAERIHPSVYVCSDYRPGSTTTSGGVSDHASNDAGQAARDIAVSGRDCIAGPPSPYLDQAVAAIGRMFGRSYELGATIDADTFQWKGYRIQIIWRTPKYGGHMGHIHIGVQRGDLV